MRLQRNDQMVFRLIPIVFLVTGCGVFSSAGPSDEQTMSAIVEDLGNDRFAVSVEGRNIEGHQVARCFGAGYAAGLLDDEGNRRFALFERTGGKITDEFRLNDGVRTQTVKGLQTYQLTNEGSPDGRDVMAVDQQLSRCENAGIPTGSN